MGIGQSFILALKSLLTNKMRAFLTMLGIIIGVVVLLLIGGGVTTFVIIKKKGHLDKKYPRKAGMPTKNPL